MKWHGYRIHPDSRPERPWWRKVWSERSGGRLEHIAWRRTDGRTVAAVQVELARIDLLEMEDERHPVPPPNPRCLQVWMFPKADVATTVIGVSKGRAQFLSFDSAVPLEWRVDDVGELAGYPAVVFTMDVWPPPDAILVDGPDSPWAPMGEK